MLYPFSNYKLGLVFNFSSVTTIILIFETRWYAQIKIDIGTRLVCNMLTYIVYLPKMVVMDNEECNSKFKFTIRNEIYNLPC